MSVIVRRAIHSDAPELAELAAATFALSGPPGSSPEAIDHFIERHLTERHFDDYLIDPEYAISVAEDGDRLVGYTMLFFGDLTDPDAAAAVRILPTSELSKVYVRATEHGGLVAAPLMEMTIAVARRNRAKSIWLGVNQENARAIRFYEKNGFETIGMKTFRLGPELDSEYIMHLAL